MCGGRPPGLAVVGAFQGMGDGALGCRALRVGHRTWFVKTGVGAHSLRVECARPSPVRWVSIERAHNVRPYNRYRQARRHLRHRASEVTFEFRGQVVARLAERQRTPTVNPKTGDALRTPFYRRCAASRGS